MEIAKMLPNRNNNAKVAPKLRETLRRENPSPIVYIYIIYIKLRINNIEGTHAIRPAHVYTRTRMYTPSKTILCVTFAFLREARDSMRNNWRNIAKEKRDQTRNHSPELIKGEKIIILIALLILILAAPVIILTPIYHRMIQRHNQEQERLQEEHQRRGGEI